MKKYGREKWGKLGKCLRIRFTPERFKQLCAIGLPCGNYSIKEIESLIKGISVTVPIEISEDAEGTMKRCVNMALR